MIALLSIKPFSKGTRSRRSCSAVARIKWPIMICYCSLVIMRSVCSDRPQSVHSKTALQRLITKYYDRKSKSSTFRWRIDLPVNFLVNKHLMINSHLELSFFPRYIFENVFVDGRELIVVTMYFRYRNNPNPFLRGIQIGNPFHMQIILRNNRFGIFILYVPILNFAFPTTTDHPIGNGIPPRNKNVQQMLENICD